MYEEEIRQQKRNIVEMVHANKIEAHMSPSMAMLEIFNVLLRDVMNTEHGIEDERSDKLVLSNGHTALALYAVYVSMGIISEQEFYTFSKRNTRIAIHPDRHHTPGMVISSGSLGHGLPNAAGIAYAWKLQGKKNRIFVLLMIISQQIICRILQKNSNRLTGIRNRLTDMMKTVYEMCC